MTDDERFCLVEKMRAAQQRFLREDDNLDEVLALEHAVDAMLAQRRPAPPGPTGLRPSDAWTAEEVLRREG